MCKLLLVAGACALASQAGAYLYFQDFESLELGPLQGQGGWTTGISGGGFDPEVVDLGGNRAVKLSVPDLLGSSSMMELVTGDVLTGNSRFLVAYDILRPITTAPLYQNLWWGWTGTGSPIYGLQWDQNGGVTAPFGFNSGANMVQSVFGRFARIEMVWDLGTGVAQSWYDGTQVDVAYPIQGIDMLFAWSISQSHDADTGTGVGEAYIDNFTLEAVPEPASFAALGLGLAIALRRRR